MQPAGEHSQITVITVAYNSMAVLPTMLASLPSGMPVVIVDNSPNADPALNALSDQFDAKLIRNEINFGFGAACNQGAALAETEFLMFLNPDAEADTGCFTALISAAEKHSKASAFNPRFLDGRGKVAFRRQTSLRSKRERYRGPLPVADQEIPVLYGAAIFLRKTMFDRIDGFDEDIFLYYEDDDLAMRLKDHGPLIYVHDAVVRHLEGRSTERTPSVAHFKAYYLARSRVFARTKHGQPWPKTEAILRGLRQMLSPLMLSRRKRSKFVGYLKGALSTLNDGGKHSR